MGFHFHERGFLMKNNGKGVPGAPIVLVCVTDQAKCERLIRSGRQLADCFSLDLKVLSVATNGPQDIMMSHELERLFKVSTQYDAEMTVYYHNDPVQSVKSYIAQANIAHIVVGVPPAPGDSKFIDGLIEAFPKIPVTIVSESGDFYLAQATPFNELIKIAIA